MKRLLIIEFGFAVGQHFASVFSSPRLLVTSLQVSHQMGTVQYSRTVTKKYRIKFSGFLVFISEFCRRFLKKLSVVRNEESLESPEILT